MISFVWSSKFPFLAGAGGSENYTAGQVRELMRRGIATRIITIGHGEDDGRKDFPDINFMSLPSASGLAELDDTIIFVTYPLEVTTKHPSYVILHCPPPTFAHGDPQYVRRAFNGKRLITTSKFAAGMWRRYLKSGTRHMHTVYPFAENEFAEVIRPERSDVIRVLFAGRLKADKGIYTLLSALHMEQLENLNFQITATTSGSHTEEGKIILKLLRAHPHITVVPARQSRADMAQLMAQHDIVVLPSTNIFWQEMFGMVSIEAQQSGCRVVASRSGGLPETNIGGLMLVKPDDPKALAIGLAKAIQQGSLPYAVRKTACSRFTLKSSVDELLKVIGYKETIPAKRAQPHGRAKLFPQIRRFSAASPKKMTQPAYAASRPASK